MLSLTKQERLVLLSLGLVIVLGSMLQFAFKKYPQLKDIVNLIENEEVYPKINVNRASYEELIRIPYIGKYTAKRIISYREKKPIASIDELKNLHGIHLKNFQKFSPYLKP